MKETPWTTGPWQLCDRGDYGDFDGNSRVICAPDNDEYLGMRLAVVQVSEGDFFEESEVNARLMNAAPEMAALIKAFTEDCSNDACEWCEDARALLAKIGGAQ